MDWIPHTVEAFGRLEWPQIFGLCVFALVCICGFLLWRHLGQMITIITQYVEQHREEIKIQAASKDIQAASKAELSKQSSLLLDISANNAKMLAKMPPGDRQICNVPLEVIAADVARKLEEKASHVADDLKDKAADVAAKLNPI